MTTDVTLGSLTPSSSIPAGSAVLVRKPVSGSSAPYSFGAVQFTVFALASDLTGLATTSAVTASINTAIAGLATSSSVTAEATARANADALLVPLAGGTMTGLLTLSGAPSANLHPATKLYVDTQISGVSGGGTPSSSTPLMDGVGAAGSSTNYARGDHVHPVDTSRYAASNPSGYQTASQVNTAIQAVVGAAPTALDTLVEIAAQLATDESAASALTTAVAAKAPIASPTFTGTVTLAATPSANDNSLKAATTAYADRAFSPTAPGAVPASGGGTTNFLRADGTWAAPAGGGGSTSVPVTTVATSGTSQSLAFPASGSAGFDVTLTGDCVFSITGGTASQRQSIFLRAHGGSGGYTPSFPVGILWKGGVPPTVSLTAGAIADYTFVTLDGGTIITGEF